MGFSWIDEWIKPKIISHLRNILQVDVSNEQVVNTTIDYNEPFIECQVSLRSRLKQIPMQLGSYVFQTNSGETLLRPSEEYTKLIWSRLHTLEYVIEFENEFALQDGATISVFDMANIELIGEAFYGVTKVLMDQMQKNRNIVAQSRDHSLIDPMGTIWCTNFMVDCYKFFDELLSIPDSNLQKEILKFLIVINTSMKRQ